MAKSFKLDEIIRRTLIMRKVADDMLEEASSQRVKTYECTEKHLHEVSNEVLRLRISADEMFENALYEVEKYDSQRADDLYKEITKNLREAEEYKRSTYLETKKRLERVNKYTTLKRIECDENFKKMEEHRNSVYQATIAVVGEVNDEMSRSSKKELEEKIDLLQHSTSLNSFN